MPPLLDVYVVSNARNREMIERFLDHFVDRKGSEDRSDEELMLLPLGANVAPCRLQDWDWEPSKTLTWIVERALQHPRRAFTVYLKQLDPSLERAILSFSPDDKVIFGVSLEDEGAKPEVFEKAKSVAHQMACEFEGRTAFIGAEEPPPWPDDAKNFNRWVYSWAAE
jgi:hypothetical protein